MKNNSLNKKKEVKALIIRNMVLRELSNQSLEKSEIEKDLKNLGIPRPNFEYHLYSKSKKEYGLIPKGIIKSRKGKLSLNWKNFKGLVNMIEYLENDPKYGNRVSFLIKRAFKEAFFSEYGDMLLNEWKLFPFLHRRIDFSKYSDSGESIKVHECIINRIYPELHGSPNVKIPGINDDIINAMIDKIDLLDILVEFAESIRGDDSLEFKIAYILKAVDISEWIREMKSRDDQRLKFLGVSDIVLVYQDKEDIMDMSNLKENTFRIFMDKVIRRALNEDNEIDMSLKNNITILDLFHFPELQIVEFALKKNISELLGSFLYRHPETREEAHSMILKRKELGFIERVMTI